MHDQIAFKPEYLYRPQQLWRRLFYLRISGYKEVRLPWGLKIRINDGDNYGGQIAALGLYDLAVTEALWRLCDEGDRAIDVGANIGFTSFVLAHRFGTGSLLAYEPHPVLFSELSRNIISLRAQGNCGVVQIEQRACKPFVGSAQLHVPADFSFHRGLR